MTHHHHHHNSSHKKHHPHPRDKGGAGGSIKNYGVWKATPLSFTAQTIQDDHSPHIYLKFDDGSSSEKEAAINVASTDEDHRLVYWLHRAWSHPVTKALTALEDGFHKPQSQDGTGLSLDFLRTTPKLLDLSQGRVLPNNKSGPNNDILDELKPILNDAIEAKAKIYIFGSNYGSGIDDVHMNQGSGPQYDNAVGEDGAIIIHYLEGDSHFEAVFLAFASQAVPTDDSNGAAESNSTPLASIAQGSQTSSTS